MRHHLFYSNEIFLEPLSSPRAQRMPPEQVSADRNRGVSRPPRELFAFFRYFSESMPERIDSSSGERVVEQSADSPEITMEKGYLEGQMLQVFWRGGETPVSREPGRKEA
jgi:hypothetical protein